MPTWPSPRSEQLGAPNPPAIRFTRGTYFGASRFTHLLRPTKLLALLYGSDRYARPSRAFTSRLPTDRLPSPLLDMTTTATGLLCRRDFHPLEWQLASLHQIRTCGFAFDHCLARADADCGAVALLCFWAFDCARKASSTACRARGNSASVQNSCRCRGSEPAAR